MVTWVSFLFLGLGLLDQLSTANPLNNVEDSNLHAIGGHLRSRKDDSDGGPWPPKPMDWPFPANESVKAKGNEGDVPPNVSKDEDVRARKELSKAFIANNCNDDDKKQILAAWEEARKISEAQTTFKIGYNYDIPHTQWLGKLWNSDAHFWPWETNFRERNQKNFGRLGKLFSDSAPAHDYLYFYCKDWSNSCDKGVQAYTTSYLGFFWSNHYITFCPPWYNLKTHESNIKKYENNKHEQKVMENFHISSGGIMFHEIWHLNKLVSSPMTDDYAYQAQNVWDLAKDKGSGYSTVNADSYHLDAIAINVQQHYKSSMSPVPWRQLKDFDAEAFAAVEQPKEETYKTKFSIWEGEKPAEADKKNPDSSKWKEITFDLWPKTPKPEEPDEPEEPKEGKLECNTATDKRYTMRDTIINIIDNDFCDMAEKQGKLDKDSGSISRTFFDDTVNKLSISMDWEPGLDFKPKSADCKRIMRELTDGCDTDTDRFKGGGKKKVGDVTYRWKPETDHTFWAGCEWKYKALHNSFWVWGASWSHDEGKKLHDRVKATGIAATDFDFKWGGGDDHREWTATFSTIIGTAGKVEGIIEDLVGHDFDVQCRET